MQDNLTLKYKNYYESLIAEYKNNNKNGCNDAKIKFYTNQLELINKQIK